MAAPIEPIGADSEITIQARQQQQRAQQSYTVMQQRQQQQLQQQRRQEQIRKLQVEAAARRQRAEKDRLMGWGADVKGAIDAPKTPMLAERITGMRPRDGSAPRGESLAENVAAEEERKLAEFMRGEVRRAAEEEHSIAQARATRAYHESLAAMSRQMQEQYEARKAYKEYSEQYAEAARRTKVTYSDYLKAFKAGETRQGYDEWKQPYIQQELFKIQYPDIAGQMAELSNISQHMAQGGWGEAYRKYGDVAPRITKLQQTIQQEKGLSPEQVQTLNAWLSDVSAQNVAANRQFAAEKSARATLREIQDAPTWQPKTLYEQAWFRSLDPGEQRLVAMSELPLLPVGASETFRTAYGEEGEAFVGRYTQQVLKGKEIRAAKTAPPDLSNLSTGETFSLIPFYRQNESPDPAYVQRFDKQLWDLLSPVTSAIKSTHESYERYIPAGSAAPIASTIVDLVEHTPWMQFHTAPVTIGSQIGQKVLGIAGIDTSQQRGIDISKSRKAFLTEIIERPVPAIAGGAVAGFAGAAHEIVKIPHYLTHPIETAQAIPREIPRFLETVRSGIETAPLETGVTLYVGGKTFQTTGRGLTMAGKAAGKSTGLIDTQIHIAEKYPTPENALYLDFMGKTASKVLDGGRIDVVQGRARPYIMNLQGRWDPVHMGVEPPTLDVGGLFGTLPKGQEFGPGMYGLSPFSFGSWTSKGLSEALAKGIKESKGKPLVTRGVEVGKALGHRVLADTQSLVLRPRAYVFHGVRTAELPPQLRAEIIETIQRRGHLTPEQWEAGRALAIEQSRRYGEPVAWLSKKWSKPFNPEWFPESEVILFYDKARAARIPRGRVFRGLTSKGFGLATDIWYSPKPAVQPPFFVRNLLYTLRREKHYGAAGAEDILWKHGEMYEGFPSYGEHSLLGHGVEHNVGLYRNLEQMYFKSEALRKDYTLKELELESRLHDLLKITGGETEPFPHAEGVLIATKYGYLDRLYGDIPAARKMQIATDISLHTKIKPGFGPHGILTKLWYRPSIGAKALATADRLDLARFGTKVETSKLFLLPEETLSWKVRAGAKDILTGQRDLPIGFKVQFVRDPAPAGLDLLAKSTGARQPIVATRATRATRTTRDPQPAALERSGRSGYGTPPLGYFPPSRRGRPPARPRMYPGIRPQARPPSRPAVRLTPRATPRPQAYPGARPQLYPSTRAAAYPAIRPPGYPVARPPGYPPQYFSGYAPPPPPPPLPPLIMSLTPTRRGRRPWRYDRYRRREVIAPIATPWEVLGIRPPEWVVRESARVAASRPQLIFVADQRRHPVADRHEAGALEKLLSGKQRKKTLFW